MKRVLLYNPPGGLWLRGEARCEQDLDSATAFTVTAPTTLAYLAAIFLQHGIDPKIVDCPVEDVDMASFADLVERFNPDMAILNASVLNLHNDMESIRTIKRLSPKTENCAVVPYFNSVPMSDIPYDSYCNVDLFITGEMEAVAYDLADYINGNKTTVEIKGVLSNNKVEKTFVRHEPISKINDLDTLPLPARDFINNNLYTRPDNGEPMATIFDGKGCPSSCIYCLAPITTGKKVRKRTVESVVNEIKECVGRYGVKNFLFRSDTFTINRKWTLRFCDSIIKECPGISWAANSKTSSFDEEMAYAMKNAGCFLVEFGIESGSDESLKLQKKGTTIDDAIKAVAAAKKAKIMTYGTVLLGFPWESMKDLQQTESFVHSLNLDFIEVHIAAPYKGTEFHEMALAEGLLAGDTISHDMASNPAINGTRYLTKDELIKFRKNMLKRFYFRATYIIRAAARISSFSMFKQYSRYGFRLFRRVVISKVA